MLLLTFSSSVFLCKTWKAAKRMTGGKEAEHQKQREEKKNMERKESGNKVWGVLRERNEQQRERRLDE